MSRTALTEPMNRQLQTTKYSSLIACLFLLVPAMLSGAGNSPGLDFLKIGVGARPAGMGEAFCAAADDASAIYWNPSGLGRLADKEITFMYNKWFEDMNYSFLAYAHPLENNSGTVAGAYYSLNTGSIRQYDNNDVLTGSFENTSRMFVLSYAREIKAGFTAGVSLKSIQDKIYDRTANAGACDIGLLYRAGNADFGLSIQNIGTGIRYITESFPLPGNVRFGVSLKDFRTAGLNLSADANLAQQEEKEFSLGAEYAAYKGFSLRAGYYSGENNAGSGARFGLGYVFGDTSIDYAFVPYDALGDTYRISLTWKFRKKPVAPAVVQQPEPVREEKPEAPKPQLEKLLKKVKPTPAQLEEAEKLYNDGKIEYSKGNLEAAKALWEKALSLAPDHDKAQQALKRVKEQLKEK